MVIIKQLEFIFLQFNFFADESQNMKNGIKFNFFIFYLCIIICEYTLLFFLSLVFALLFFQSFPVGIIIIFYSIPHFLYYYIAILSLRRTQSHIFSFSSSSLPFSLTYSSQTLHSNAN